VDNTIKICHGSDTGGNLVTDGNAIGCGIVQKDDHGLFLASQDNVDVI
jgi:hypothetical protein